MKDENIITAIRRIYPEGRLGAGGGGNAGARARYAIVEQLQLVAEQFEGSFQAATLARAFRARHPEHERWSETGIGAALLRWQDVGWLVRDGAQRPAVFTRTERWGEARIADAAKRSQYRGQTSTERSLT